MKGFALPPFFQYLFIIKSFFILFRYSQVFSVYLVTLGLIWLIFLYCDIRQHQGSNVIRLEQHHLHARGSTSSNNTSSESVRSSRNNNSSSNGSSRHHRHQHHQQQQRQHQNLKYWKDVGSGGGVRKCHRKDPYFHRGKQTQRSDSVKLEDGISHLSVSVTPSNEPCRIYSSDSYTFCRSRHSGSFYLKIGAAGRHKHTTTR